VKYIKKDEKITIDKWEKKRSRDRSFYKEFVKITSIF